MIADVGSNYVGLLDAVTKAFGPAGAAFAVVAAVLFYFYRLDHLRKQKGLKEAHDRRDDRESKFINVIEQNAAACERSSQSSLRLADGIERLATTAREIQERQSRELADVLREIRR